MTKAMESWSKESVNQHVENRKQVSLSGGFHRCIEMFTIAEDGHESHALALIYILRSIYNGKILHWKSLRIIANASNKLSASK